MFLSWWLSVEGLLNNVLGLGSVGFKERGEGNKVFFVGVLRGVMVILAFVIFLLKEIHDRRRNNYNYNYNDQVNIWEK